MPEYNETVIRAALHVGTRLPNGAIVTHIIDDRPSSKTAELLNNTMAAALDRWDLCPHATQSAVWVVPVGSQRIMCEECARYEDSSWQHAPCPLCDSSETVLLSHVIVAALPGWPGHWVTWIIGSLCPACVLRETGLQVTL